jgi:hypothetical protein
MKHVFKIMSAVLIVFVFYTTTFPQIVADKIKPAITFAVQPFLLQQVRLLDSPYKQMLELDHTYLLSLSVDQLLHNFRVTAGLPSKATPLQGWESPTTELRGHFTGHYMSACALMYASTGDARMKAKGDSVVAGLAECQKALGTSGYLSGYPESFIDRVETRVQVWAPYYTLHKIMAGLYDMYIYCGNNQALDIVMGMVKWAKGRADKLSDEQFQQMLNTEFGGMAEVLWNLYALTGNTDCSALANRFEKRRFLDSLAVYKDRLRRLHANTHVPQVIGAARKYELTSDRKYYTISNFFLHQIVDVRAYATGGTSNGENWQEEPYNLSTQLGANSHENCVTHNMLKLAKHIFCWTADPYVADYYERALFSGIFGTQHPEDGGSYMYYVPMRSGSFRTFRESATSFVCCSGTGIESFAKLGESIYFHNNNDIYVNLFIPSEVVWQEKNVRIRQENRFPEQQGTKLTILTSGPVEIGIMIRIPYWAANGGFVTVNGEKLSAFSSPQSYLSIRRIWRNGDIVEVNLPMNFHFIRMPDKQNEVAILYGPLVLAGALGTQGMTDAMKYGMGQGSTRGFRDTTTVIPEFVVTSDNPNDWIKPVPGKPLTFQTVNVGKPNDVTLIPFYTLFGQRYALYFDLYTPEQWASRNKD